MGVGDLSLDETKQYIAKGGGIRTDIDAYISCLRLYWKAESFSQIIRSGSLQNALSVCSFRVVPSCRVS